MKKLLVKLVQIALSFSFFLLLAPAYAHIFTEKECQAISRDVEFFATLRDKYSEAQVMGTLVPMMDEHKGQEDSYIVDDEDIKAMIDFVDAIYKFPTISPPDVGKVVLTACIKTSVKLSGQI